MNGRWDAGRPDPRGRTSPRRAECRDGGERGAATAELAIALPVVVIVLLLGVGVLGAGLRMVTLQDAAADAARILGRGDGAGSAGGVIARADPRASMTVERSADLVCVTASADARVLGAFAVPIRAVGCALDGGR